MQKWCQMIQQTKDIKNALCTVYAGKLTRHEPVFTLNTRSYRFLLAHCSPDPTILSNILRILSSLNLMFSHSIQKLNYDNKSVEQLFVPYYQVSRHLTILIDFDESVEQMWIIDDCFPMAWLSQTKTNRVEWNHKIFIWVLAWYLLLIPKSFLHGCMRPCAELDHELRGERTTNIKCVE